MYIINPYITSRANTSSFIKYNKNEPIIFHRMQQHTISASSLRVTQKLQLRN